MKICRILLFSPLDKILGPVSWQNVGNKSSSFCKVRNVIPVIISSLYTMLTEYLAIKFMEVMEGKRLPINKEACLICFFVIYYYPSLTPPTIHLVLVIQGHLEVLTDAFLSNTVYVKQIDKSSFIDQYLLEAF